jgi:hypothetical protein
MNCGAPVFPVTLPKSWQREVPMKDFTDLPTQAKLKLLAAIIPRMKKLGVRTLDAMAGLQHRTMDQLWEEACLDAGIERCTIPSRLMGIKDESTFVVH